MADNDTSLLTERPGASSTALLPMGMAEQRNGDWATAAALTQPAAANGPNIMVYVHAIRRHWLMATGIGLLCAAIAGPAVWISIGSKYTATALLKVAMVEKQIVAQQTGGTDQASFDIYKATQSQALQNRFVIISALRKTEVARLPSVREREGSDPVGWLLSQLSVGFPGRAEWMEVSVTRPDAKEAKTLVTAVVESYMTDVVNAELFQKMQKLSQLDDAYTDTEKKIREKRELIKTEAEQVGTSDTEMLSTKQKLALDELTGLRQTMMQLEIELRTVKTNLAAQKSLLESANKLDPNDAEVEMLVQSDPFARDLATQIMWRNVDQGYQKKNVAAGAASRYVDRYTQELDGMQEQYNNVRMKMAQLVQKRRQSDIQREITKLQTAMEVMSENQQKLQTQVESKQREAEKFGKSNVVIEMMRNEINNLDTMLTTISREREELRVEVRAPARVTWLRDDAIPDTPSNRTTRAGLTLMALLAAFCLPAGVVAFWDSRAQRINNCTDVSQGLRLSVIGSVPLIPSRVIRGLGSPSKRNQSWHVRLTESVDGIAARVLRKAETELCRVIMVSSASGGEGKTTLATQLALSLARAGRRTVLVDFDLRRPAFDEVFGLPLEPGVCEALRLQEDITACVHDISGNNMAVVTAGRWDRNALASLSNGTAASLFKKLREEFDFVIVDTSPILPVADARFVSQHVDSVVLSVFRDISQAPKIQAACEILAAFGVQTIEAVVTGPNDNMYGEHIGYESTIPA